MAGLANYNNGLAKVVDNLPQSIMIVDSKFRIRYVNTSAPKFFGYKESELILSDVFTLIDPVFWKNIKQNITKLLSDGLDGQGSSMLLGATVILRDGKKIPTQVTLARLLRNDNKPEVFFRFDTLPAHPQLHTAQEKQIQAAAVGSELIHALDMLNDSVVIFDDKWRYQFVNKAGWEVLKRNKEDILGQNLWKLRPFLVGSSFEKTARKAMKTQKTYSIEEYYPKRQSWYRTNFYPSPHALVCQMENVTALKETEHMNKQLLGTLEEAMEVYWSEENRPIREKKTKRKTTVTDKDATLT